MDERENPKSQAPSSKEAPNPKLQMGGAQFQVGETVYSVLQQDVRGMVLRVELNPNGFIYHVAWAEAIAQDSPHYAMELSREPLFTTPTR